VVQPLQNQQGWLLVKQILRFATASGHTFSRIAEATDSIQDVLRGSYEDVSQVIVTKPYSLIHGEWINQIKNAKCISRTDIRSLGT
jgi:hypothetical protein